MGILRRRASSPAGCSGVSWPIPSQFDAQAAEQRFQLLVEAVTDYAIYMLEPDGRIATWNPGARRFKGYEADEIIGRHFSTFFTEEDAAAGLPEHILRTAAEEGRFEAEGWRVARTAPASGRRSWSIRSAATTARLLGFAKITRDVTERREAERALLRKRAALPHARPGRQAIMRSTCSIPTAGSATGMPGAAAIKGYRADEIVGQHFSRFYTEEDRAAGEPKRALETALREGKYEKEAWRVRKDGTRFWASVLIDPIFDENGTLDRLRQDHPRHHRQEARRRTSWRRRATPCSRRRSCRRWAS